MGFLDDLVSTVGTRVTDPLQEYAICIGGTYFDHVAQGPLAQWTIRAYRSTVCHELPDETVANTSVHLHMEALIDAKTSFWFRANRINMLMSGFAPVVPEARVPTGDTEFDRIFSIESNEPATIANYFSEADVRQRLLYLSLTEAGIERVDGPRKVYLLRRAPLTTVSQLLTMHSALDAILHRLVNIGAAGDDGVAPSYPSGEDWLKTGVPAGPRPNARPRAARVAGGPLVNPAAEPILDTQSLRDLEAAVLNPIAQEQRLTVTDQKPLVNAPPDPVILGGLPAPVVPRRKHVINELTIPLRDALDDHERTCAVVYALAAGSDTESRIAVLESVKKTIGEIACEVSVGFAPEVDALRPAVRAALVDLSIPTLHHLIPIEYHAFVLGLKTIIDSRPSHTIFEYGIFQSIVRYLGPLSIDGDGPEPSPPNHGEIRQAAIVLLSAVGYAAFGPGGRARIAFDNFSGTIEEVEEPMTMMDPTECGLKQIDAALRVLATANEGVAEEVVIACSRVACADGRVGVTGWVTLRAIADGLDINLPIGITRPWA